MNQEPEQNQPENTPAPAPETAPVKKPKKVKPPSRGERWQNAAQAVQDAIAELRSVWEENVQNVNDAIEELRSVQEEYESWRDNLPENMQGSATYEKLDTICNIDLGEMEEPNFEAIEDAAQEALDADLPLGFGRD
jgi:hypothetical protein